MTTDERAQVYFQQAARSFELQPEEFSILLKEDEPTMLSDGGVGWQTLGIVSRPYFDMSSHIHEGGIDEVAVAVYNLPAIWVYQVRVEGNHMFVSILRSHPGVMWNGKSVRLFPDIREDFGANRAFTVNLVGNSLVYNRGDGEFFISRPPSSGEGKWELQMQRFSIDTSEGIASALVGMKVAPNRMYTIQSPADLDAPWALCEYDMDELKLRELSRKPISPFRYGIAERDGELWTITDVRGTILVEEQMSRLGKKRELVQPGIYRGDELVVPGPIGNGLCFLQNGGAIISTYGAEFPAPWGLGRPSILSYVPPKLFR